MFPHYDESIHRRCGLRALASIACTLALFAGSANAADENILLVNSDFKEFLKGSRPEQSVTPGDRSQLPLLFPTSVHNNCVLKFAETEAGPALTIETPILKEGQAQPNSGSYFCNLAWNFQDLLIQGGVYDISFDIDSPAPDRLYLTFAPSASFKNSGFATTAAIKEEELKVNVPLFESASAPPKGKVKIRYDLNANTYSLTMDGDGKVVDSEFLHQAHSNLKGKLYFQGFRIGVSATKLGDSAPLFTLSNLKIEASEIPEQAPKKVITFIGDSITQGVGAANGTQFVNRLAAQWDASEYYVRNLGVSGTTLSKKGDSPYWRTTQFKQAAQPKSTAFFVMLGTNDSKPQNFAHKATLKEDLSALLAHLKESSPEAKIFVGIPVPVVKTNFGISEESLAQLRPLIREAATEAGAQVVDFSEGLKDHPEWIPDGVHPSADGHAEMARIINDAFVSGGIVAPTPQ